MNWGPGLLHCRITLRGRAGARCRACRPATQRSHAAPRRLQAKGGYNAASYGFGDQPEAEPESESEEEVRDGGAAACRHLQRRSPHRCLLATRAC